MAIQGGIPVAHNQVFPAGAFVVGEVERIEDYDKRQAGVEDCQSRDKATGLRLWAVRVVDVDPEGRRGQAEVVVKVAAEVQPVPPDALPGMPFRPVVFEGLTVTPWIDDRGNRPKIGYSFRATSMHAPDKRPESSGPASGQGRVEPGKAA
ncbi:plasmid replication, integration and excision activator [Thalassiella azotivora]